MAKRFTDTDKWKDAWFCDLEPAMKVFWMYLLDNCDHAGFWKVNFKLASVMVGAMLDKQSAIKALGRRVRVINEEKWFIQKFITFQYGVPLYENNSAHRSVLTLLSKEGIADEVEVRPSPLEPQRKRISRVTREKIFLAAGMTCEYCAKRCGTEELVIDHFIPVSAGGTNNDDNLVCACAGCNAKKSDSPALDFIEKNNLEKSLSGKVLILIAPLKELKGAANELPAPKDKEKDQDQYQEKDKDSSNTVKPVLVKRLTPDHIVDLWTRKMLPHGFKAIPSLGSGKHRDNCLAAFEHLPTIEAWESLFDKVIASSFCRGHNERGWIVPLIWLVNFDNALRVLASEFDDGCDDPFANMKTKEVPA